MLGSLAIKDQVKLAARALLSLPVIDHLSNWHLAKRAGRELCNLYDRYPDAEVRIVVTHKTYPAIMASLKIGGENHSYKITPVESHLQVSGSKQEREIQRWAESQTSYGENIDYFVRHAFSVKYPQLMRPRHKVSLRDPYGEDCGIL